MASSREQLTVFTPLPPERNGIADYSVMLLAGLQAHYACRVACADWLGEAPAGIPVVDPLLAHRQAGARVVHQIGNNPGHAFVLRALRRLPGVTTLHDPGLLYLYEMAGESAGSIRAGMVSAVPGLAETYGRHDRESGVRTRANHLLFDLAGEILARSRAVIVHSQYARNRLRLIHGEAATGHVVVVPHMLPDHPMPERAAARARLGIPDDSFLVVTAGFATAAKRFDWTIEALARALDQLPRGGPNLVWRHAGPERPEEYDLSGAIAAQPALHGRAMVAGYLSEAALDDHIAAADALVNLRFPSSGESSGTLARAFAAGVCCIVSDTGAYAELPRDAVIHVPIAATVPMLAETLAALAADPDRALAIGARCRAWSEAEMALPTVARLYHATIEASLDRPVLAGRSLRRSAAPSPLIALEAGAALDRGAVAAALAGRQGPCRLLLATPDLEALAALSLRHPAWLATLLPVQVRLQEALIQDRGRPGLLLELDCGYPA